MQAIALGDALQLTEASRIEVESDHPQVPTGRANLAFRAAELLCLETGISRGVRINIKKRIPIAAGLAGGSTDAAAVLRGLNSLWKLGLPDKVLFELAARLGSDVAFCLLGGTALGRGRGEKLTVLPPLPRCGVIIVKMPFAVSTKEVYQRFRQNLAQVPTTERMLHALHSGSRQVVMEAMSNMLEQVTITMHPEIAKVKELLLKAGAGGVLMSGSGPTVFGLTETLDEAQQVASRITGSFDVFVTETLQGTGD
jgi:4-diphosphocytidyl-2-C-methyl-D-erythritol kinase